MDLEYATVDLGDLCAARLRHRIEPGDGRPVLVLGDDDAAVRVDADFGTVEQSILGIERMMSGLAEYRDLLRESA